MLILGSSWRARDPRVAHPGRLGGDERGGNQPSLTYNFASPPPERPPAKPRGRKDGDGGASRRPGKPPIRRRRQLLRPDPGRLRPDLAGRPEVAAGGGGDRRRHWTAWRPAASRGGIMVGGQRQRRLARAVVAASASASVRGGVVVRPTADAAAVRMPPEGQRRGLAGNSGSLALRGVGVGVSVRCGGAVVAATMGGYGGVDCWLAPPWLVAAARLVAGLHRPGCLFRGRIRHLHAR
ncbi:hypothetical protein OsI_28441 [Oryza sativa Indica Group]|uniref:Uncharacterized protein n=1 Tax=Oryza sativa subsp. indica TaxID=39946 RepID=B8B8Q5_ORYSI|nr:hypothetical protein OsI_28441 [Oryza sativa Indica Group]